MSASTEHLLREIIEQEDAIRAVAEAGHDTRSMREELMKMRARLQQANGALTESKILKG